MEVTRRSAGSGIRLSVEGADVDRVPTDEGNLAWRAAQLVAAEVDVEPDVDIRITKRIPVAGGMAGGSADAAGALLEGVLGACDRLHLSVDLDVLPAAVAPGVSAPAGFGVELSVVRAVVRRAAASGRLGVLEVAELNPAFDVDGRTARTASRLVDEALRHLPGA